MFLINKKIHFCKIKKLENKNLCGINKLFNVLFKKFSPTFFWVMNFCTMAIIKGDMQIIQKDLNYQIYFKALGINAFNETLQSHLPNQKFTLNFTSVDLREGKLQFVYLWNTWDERGIFGMLWTKKILNECLLNWKYIMCI